MKNLRGYYYQLFQRLYHEPDLNLLCKGLTIPVERAPRGVCPFGSFGSLTMKVLLFNILPRKPTMNFQGLHIIDRGVRNIVMCYILPHKTYQKFFRASYKDRGSEIYGNILYSTPEPYYDFQGLYIIKPLKEPCSENTT